MTSADGCPGGGNIAEMVGRARGIRGAVAAVRSDLEASLHGGVGDDEERSKVELQAS